MSKSSKKLAVSLVLTAGLTISLSTAYADSYTSQQSLVKKQSYKGYTKNKINGLSPVVPPIVVSIGMQVLNHTVQRLVLDNQDFAAIAREWKVQLGLYDLIGDFPFNADTMQLEKLNLELSQTLNDTQAIYVNLTRFMSEYNKHQFEEASNNFAKDMAPINTKLNYIDGLFDIKYTSLGGEANRGQSMRAFGTFDELMKKIKPQYSNKQELSQYLTSHGFNHEYMETLEHEANYITDTAGTAYSSNTLVSRTNFVEAYFSKYYNFLNDYSVSPGGVAPWQAVASEYERSTQNAILTKARYDLFINSETLQLTMMLQNIYNLEALSIYMHYKLGITEAPLPSYISQSDTGDDAYQKAMDKLYLVYTSLDDNLLNVAKTALDRYPQLPKVTGLPLTCLQPDVIASSFTINDIEKSGVYWNGYGGANTGKLSTFCQNISGKYSGPKDSSGNFNNYSSTFPLFLNSDSQHPHSSSFCNLLTEELGSYLFCKGNAENDGKLIGVGSQKCSKSELTGCNNNVDTGLVSLGFHIDTDSDAFGKNRPVEFDDNTLTLIKTSIEYSISNITLSSTQKFKNLSIEQTKHAPFWDSGKYMVFNPPLYWADSNHTNVAYPTSIPFILYFKRSDRVEQCPITIRPGIYVMNYQSPDPRGGGVVLAEPPRFSYLGQDNPAAYRCGTNGQFKVTYNPNNSDTLNVGMW